MNFAEIGVKFRNLCHCGDAHNMDWNTSQLGQWNPRILDSQIHLVKLLTVWRNYHFLEFLIFPKVIYTWILSLKIC